MRFDNLKESELRELLVTVENDLDIDIGSLYEKIAVIFNDIHDTLFTEIRPQKIYETRYEEYSVKSFIVVDYLCELQKKITELSEKIKKSAEGSDTE